MPREQRLPVSRSVAIVQNSSFRNAKQSEERIRISTNLGIGSLAAIRKNLVMPTHVLEKKQIPLIDLRSDTMPGICHVS